MAYNSISIKPYIKSHLELQREITIIELAPTPYFFVLSICLVYMNMFAMFDENPAMTLQDIKETKRYGRTDTRTHAHTDARTDIVKTVYPPQTKSAGGIIKADDTGSNMVANILPTDTPSTQGWGLKVKLYLFLKVVMLHIK